MVIGNGMIAQAFESYRSQDRFIIFASGISHSTHTTAEDFIREEKLLTTSINDNPGGKFVYFSTCSIYDASLAASPYVQHKKNMEALIASLTTDHIIFRLSNPVGKTTNTTTLVNFFTSNIKTHTAFIAWKNASRNIIDVEDMYLICDEILQNHQPGKKIINIANPHNYSVPYILKTIETYLGIKGNYTLVDKGDSPNIDISDIEPLFRKFNINFENNYLQKILQKYFTSQ